MHRSGADGALRHLDFTVIDIITMQLALCIMYYLTDHKGLIYLDFKYRILAAICFVVQISLCLFSNLYDHVFTRDALTEFRALVINILDVWLIAGLFLICCGYWYSLKEIMIAAILFFDLDFLCRQRNKERHLYQGLPKHRVVIVSTQRNVVEAAQRLENNKTSVEYEISGILLLDKETPENDVMPGVPVLNAKDERILDDMAHWWIDDVFLLLDEDTSYPRHLVESFLLMGVTVHTGISALDTISFSETGVEELGNYKVLTNTVRFVSDKAMLMKRLLDIVGGFVGVILTGIIFVFVAPAIYIKSPGPIFFSQERIGQNGRTFRIYKFRSMYMDAEKRLADLMEQNKIQGGLMFKMDDDPRIIGSEKKGKDGKPKGIGNLIRNTSLDEFPQFFNVLKGDMSLVGTRPPTVREWNQYEPSHRIRMSAKPGITGMWQVSGRSAITDFEEVVALDKQYIEHWSFWLDIKILFKTVKVVLKHEGAS